MNEARPDTVAPASADEPAASKNWQQRVNWLALFIGRSVFSVFMLFFAVDRSNRPSWLSMTLHRRPPLKSLFHPHVVGNGGNAFDGAGNLDCFVDVSFRTDETTQLDFALEGFDIDLG